MKKLNLKSIYILLAIAGISMSATAQNRENPRKSENPRKTQSTSTQTTQQPQRVPVRVVRPPVYIPPAPVYYPNYGNNPVVETYQNTEEFEKMRGQENIRRAEQSFLRDMFQVSSDIQTFSPEDVTRPFEIKGQKGFVIQFPEFAFVDQSGNIVTGDVEINLSEFTTFGDMAASGYSTMTTDGQILETAGMINLEAKSGNNKLLLAPGKEITITVPGAATDRDFRVFYGVGPAPIKWTVNPVEAAQSNSQEESFDGYTIKMLKPTFYSHGSSGDMYAFKNGKSLHDYVNSNLKVPQELRNNILKAGIPFVYTIEFNNMGRIKSVTAKNRDLTDKSLIAPLNKQIEKILKEAPAMAMTEGNLSANKPYDIIFATDKNYTGLKRPMPTLGFPASENAAASESSVNEFTMKSSTLSKINCDRFSGMNGRDTAKFEFDRADAMVYIVVKNMRALVNPVGQMGKYKMTGIPTGTPVRYVAVIYDDNGNVTMTHVDTNFKNEKVVFPPAIPFNAMILKNTLDMP